METIESKLDAIEELIKGNLMPTMNTPNLMPQIDQPASPGRPRGPGIPKSTFKPNTGATPGAPPSKKNPVAIAQQIQNKDMKEAQIKQAKEGLSFNSRGQWTLRR